MDKISEIVVLKNIAKELILKIRKQDFLTYFKKVSIVKISDDSIVFGVVSSFARDNISHKFYDEIKETINSLMSNIKYIDFVVDANIDNPSNHKVIDCLKEYKEFNSKKKKEDIQDANNQD
jgi:chromosomal replication initiation ATPase DnaA